MIDRTIPMQAISLLAVLIIFSAGKGAAAEINWETEWERTVKAAEQEGQVVVYKISGDTEWNAFQKKYPLRPARCGPSP